MDIAPAAVVPGMQSGPSSADSFLPMCLCGSTSFLETSRDRDLACDHCGLPQSEAFAPLFTPLVTPTR
jgi:hypothetical protein